MKIVLRFPRGRDPLRPFLAASLVLHLALIAAIFVAPFFRNSRPPLDDAMVVALAGPLPGPPTVAAPGAAPVAPPRPPAVRPPEPKGPSLVPDVPAPRKENQQKKKEEPKAEEQESSETKPDQKASPAAVPEPGTAGAPTAPGPTGSGVTSLDVGGASTGWYGEAVRAALQAAWRPQSLVDATETYSVVVRFEIARDGTALNVEIETPSGIPSLDRSVLSAVTAASPFPPAPASWKAPTLTARIRFDLKPDAN